MTRRRALGIVMAIGAAGAAPALAGPRTPATSPVLARAIKDVVIANRILANQGVVDAYGHVSLRHPEDSTRFLLARSRSPELVEPSDVMTFALDGSPIDALGRTPYIERFIHAAILSARPELEAVIHAHPLEVLPYTITAKPLIPVFQNAGVIGAHVPVWDIATRFGDTNLLVNDLPKAADLALTLGAANAVLMRGHGLVAVGRSLIEALRIAIYLKLDAAVLSEASRLGPFTPLSPGEIAKVSDVAPDAPELRRAWEYWATRAGVAALLAP